MILSAIDDSGVDSEGRMTSQRVSGTAAGDERLESIALLQAYGFTAHPIPGSAPIILEIGGSRGRVVAILPDEPRYRPTGLSEGEVAIYTDEGVAVHLKRGNVVEINASGGLTLNADTTIEGTLQVNGTIDATQDISTLWNIVATLAAQVGTNLTVLGLATVTGPGSLIDGKSPVSHTHSGVQAGGGNTGPVN
jgi:phage baseplate assembly protein V